MKAIALVLLLAGCSQHVAEDTPAAPAAPPAPFRACQAAPPQLPTIKTIEALKDRHDRLDVLYRDCAERLRRTVEAYELNTPK